MGNKMGTPVTFQTIPAVNQSFSISSMSRSSSTLISNTSSSSSMPSLSCLHLVCKSFRPSDSKCSAESPLQPLSSDSLYVLWSSESTWLPDFDAKHSPLSDTEAGLKTSSCGELAIVSRLQKSRDWLLHSSSFS